MFFGTRKLIPIGIFLTSPLLAFGDLAGKTPAAPTSSTAAAPVPVQLASHVERGKKIYRTNCLQCHNADPRKPGSQGPAIYKSSLELLSAKVLLRKYPPGYTPQRKTAIMPPLPFLKNEIPNLHAYLNSVIE